MDRTWLTSCSLPSLHRPLHWNWGTSILICSRCYDPLTWNVRPSHCGSSLLAYLCQLGVSPTDYGCREHNLVDRFEMDRLSPFFWIIECRRLYTYVSTSTFVPWPYPTPARLDVSLFPPRDIPSHDEGVGGVIIIEEWSALTRTRLPSWIQRVHRRSCKSTMYTISGLDGSIVDRILRIGWSNLSVRGSARLDVFGSKCERVSWRGGRNWPEEPWAKWKGWRANAFDENGIMKRRGKKIKTRQFSTELNRKQNWGGFNYIYNLSRRR